MAYRFANLPNKFITTRRFHKCGEVGKFPAESSDVKIKARLKRCGREVRLVLPANSGEEMPVHQTQSLIKAVARAHDWYRRIIQGELTGSRSIANATGLDERYVNRIFQFAFLSPDIVECILDGRQPAKMTLESFRTHLPIEWAAQRQRLGFSGR